MAYIGQAPANKPVSSSDLEDGLITNSKLAQDIISGETELATAPADTDELLISDAGVLKRIDASLIGGAGITMADNWRLTSGFTGDTNPISSNLERNDTAPALSYLGSQMTNTSGTFSFPSTGIYHVIFNASFKLNGDDRSQGIYILATTDNSNYATATESSSFIQATGGNMTYQHVYTDQLFDITDTTNQKVRFQVAMANQSNECLGNTVRDLTAMRFIRLGDT